MTKTYSLRERTTGPANVVAVAVPRTHKGASGSLSVGATYYYKAIANGYADYYDDTNAWLSVPSDETPAVTTTSSKRVIWIHTDNNVSGQEETTIIRTETSEDYRMFINGVAQRHFPRIDNYRRNHYTGCRTDKSTEFNRYEMTTSAISSLEPGEVIEGETSGARAYVVTDPDGGTTFKVWTIVGTFSTGETLNGSISGNGVGTFTSLSAKDGWVFEDYSSSSLFVFPVFDTGLPLLMAESDKTNDPVTPQDVYEWLIDNGTPQYCDGIPLFQDDSYTLSSGKNYCNFFRWRFSIYTKNFKIPGGTVVSQALAKHMFRNGEFTMGEIDSNGATTNGAGLIGAWHLAMYNTLSRGGGSKIKIYGSIMGMVSSNSSSCNRDPFYQITYGAATLKNSVLRTSGRWNPPLNIEDTRMMVSGEIGSSSAANTNVTKNVSWNSDVGGAYSSTEVTFEDSFINRFRNYVYYVDSYYLSTGCRVVQNYDMKYDISQFDYLARFRCSNGTSGSDNVLRFSNSIKLKLIDKDGNPIVGAKLYANDKDGYNGLFTKNWVARTWTRCNKDLTSFTAYSGTLSVGKYYRAGDEIIKILSKSGSNYTMARAQMGSTANNIGGSASNRMTYLYELQDYLETDSNGKCETMLNHSYYKSLDNSVQYHYIQESDLSYRSPYDIEIKAEGFETYTMKYVAEEKKDMVIELKDAVPVMTSTDSRTVVKLDPKNSGVNRDKVIIT